ncbi:MAG TPA: succinate dehydrogenase, cytochrome b556 subunit [Methylophilaceae bacterium]|nr:succinate dehydrogenase, cytochrome b556 subunit [Methylophilaceae bacterium]
MSVNPAIKKKRPKNLNLTKVRLPIPALVSILHRASGVFLFLMIPLLLWALQSSLESEQGFQQLQAIAAHPLTKLLLLVFAWAFLHHFFAGIRHLALDARWGVELKQARLTSKLVLIVSVLLTLATGAWLW